MPSISFRRAWNYVYGKLLLVQNGNSSLEFATSCTASVEYLQHFFVSISFCFAISIALSHNNLSGVWTNTWFSGSSARTFLYAFLAIDLHIVNYKGQNLFYLLLRRDLSGSNLSGSFPNTLLPKKKKIWTVLTPRFSQFHLFAVYLLYCITYIIYWIPLSSEIIREHNGYFTERVHLVMLL